MDKKDIANNFIHLTNVAIQKTADGYDKGKGCKWLFSRVKAYLASRFGDDAVRGCLQAINTVITRSLESVYGLSVSFFSDKRRTRVDLSMAFSVSLSLSLSRLPPCFQLYADGRVPPVW